MEIIDKKEFATVILNENNKTIMVHMTAFSVMDSNVYLFQHAQIILLEVAEVTIPSEYADYTNVFFLNSMAKQPKHTGINDHLINLIDDK